MIKLYNGYKAKKTNFSSLDVGGYVLKILNVEYVVKPSTKWLVFSFDIAEGDNKDFYKKRYQENTNEDKKWSGNYWLRIPEESSEYFGKQKTEFENVMACIEESNAGYYFNGEETTLKGKLVGGVFGREEWQKQDGETSWSVKCRYFTDILSIRSGDFKMPKDKPLKNKPVTTDTNTANFAFTNTVNFTEIADDDFPF